MIIIDNGAFFTPFAAAVLYDWHIHESVMNDTDVMSCDSFTQIYNPFNAMNKSCNYYGEK